LLVECAEHDFIIENRICQIWYHVVT
jgi:hypothetical protein